MLLPNLGQDFTLEKEVEPTHDIYLPEPEFHKALIPFLLLSPLSIKIHIQIPSFFLSLSLPKIGNKG